MHLLAVASLKNRALIALVTIVVAVFGGIALTSLKQELTPSVQFPVVVISSTYPGASPEVVNQDVSTPIETAIQGVPGLEETTATSSTNLSIIQASFTYGTDLVFTEQKIQQAINRIKDDLPETVSPQILSGGIDDFPVVQIAVTGGADADTEALARQIEASAIADLRDIDGVREVRLNGAVGERIAITPDETKMFAAGVTRTDISDALEQNGVLIPAGQITEEGKTLSAQTGERLTSVEQVAELPVIGTKTVKLSEVATVELAPNPVSTISRVNGEPALTLAITKLSSANTVEVSNAIKAELPNIEESLDGVKLTVIFDQAPFIEKSIKTLATEGLLGLVFAVLVILVFLFSVSATLVTAISIPTSVLMTFIGLQAANYSLNILTLGALTIAIGRVVDDSIVVIENIKRNVTAGGNKVAEITKAVREVAGAVTASTVTTVAVFLPLAFVTDLTGELFRPFALTITVALLSSLLVSLTIVPVLAYWFIRAKAPKAGAPVVAAGEEEVTKLQRGYHPIMRFTLKRPAITLVASLLVLIVTFGLTPLLKTNFLGADGNNSINMTQTLGPGTSLDAQLDVAVQTEEALLELDGIDIVQVTFGGASDFQAFFGGGTDGVITYAITTSEDADQEALQNDIRDTTEAIDNDAEVAISAGGGGFGGSTELEVKVTSPTQDKLALASDELVAALKKQDSLTQVESNLGTSRPLIEIAIDRMKAAQQGYSEVMLAGAIAQQTLSQPIGKITLDDASVQVYLAPESVPSTLAELRELEIMTPKGPVALNTLAEVNQVNGPVSITTVKGSRSATISATPVGDNLTVANAAVAEVLAETDLPAGVTAEIGGVSADQASSFQSLGLALLAAILIVYVVMVATFRSLLQPLLLLVSVPFAATGAIALQLVSGIPLGVASLIGVLMLIGIVVTNAIVLVDLINQLRTRGEPLRDAVFHGSSRRLRPILMTALATIFALTPMALGITGEGGFISQPLALVVIGGLISSTVLTLIVLPALYFVVERGRERRSERRRERREAKQAARHTAA